MLSPNNAVLAGQTIHTMYVLEEYWFGLLPKISSILLTFQINELKNILLQRDDMKYSNKSN